MIQGIAGKETVPFLFLEFTRIVSRLSLEDIFPVGGTLVEDGDAVSGIPTSPEPFIGVNPGFRIPRAIDSGIKHLLIGEKRSIGLLFLDARDGHHSQKAKKAGDSLHVHR